MRGETASCRVFHERANPLGDPHAAGLAQQLHGATARGDLAARAWASVDLPGAVESLDSDQPAAGHPGTVPSLGWPP